MTGISGNSVEEMKAALPHIKDWSQVAKDMLDAIGKDKKYFDKKAEDFLLSGICEAVAALPDGIAQEEVIPTIMSIFRLIHKVDKKHTRTITAEDVLQELLNEISNS